MRTPLLFPLLLLCISTALPAHAQGVMLPPGEEVYAERAVAVGQDGTSAELAAPDRVFSAFVGDQLPPSDRSQFWLVAYTDATSPESRLLLQDLERHEGLRVLRDWCKFVVIDRTDSPAAEARHLAQRLSGADVPTLLLFAHPEHPVFGEGGPVGWRYVFQRAGYGGDAGLLARNLYQSLQRLYSQAGVAVEQCPQPYCPPSPRPSTPPWSPGPGPTDWHTPPLPRLDGASGGWGLDRVVTWLGWGVLILAAGAAVYWLGRKTSLPVLLLCALFLAGGPGMAAAAETSDPGPASMASHEEHPPPVEAERSAEENAEEPVEGVLYPPIPTQWEWLRAVVREEVRQGIDPIQVQSFLRNTLAHIELTFNTEIAAIRRSADTAQQASTAAVVLLALGVGLNLATLACCVVCLGHLRGLQPPPARRRR